MIIKSIESQRLYVQIADQLRTLLDDNKIAVGGRLPSERDLARQLGVSRPSLREALIALEIEGRIEIRMGAGVFVCEPPRKEERVATSLGDSPLEVMRARALIETAIIAQITPHIRPKDIQRLKEINAAMDKRLSSGVEHLMVDREFHIAIAELTKNPVIVRLVGDLFDDRFSPISAKFNAHFQTRDTLVGASGEHRDIVSALEVKDTIQAQAAMQRHLKSSYDRMVVGIKNNKQTSTTAG